MKALVCWCFILVYLSHEHNAQEMCTHVSLMRNYFPESVVRRVGEGRFSIVYVLGPSDDINLHQLHRLKDLVKKHRTSNKVQLEVMIINPNYAALQASYQRYLVSFTFTKVQRKLGIDRKKIDPYDVYLFDRCGRLSTVLKSPYSVVKWYPGALRSLQRVLFDRHGVCGLCKEQQQQHQQQQQQQQLQRRQQQQQQQQQKIQQKKRQNKTKVNIIEKPDQRVENIDKNLPPTSDSKKEDIERQRNKVEENFFVKMFKGENEIDPPTVTIPPPTLPFTDPPLVTSKEDKSWLDQILKHTVSLPPEPHGNWTYVTEQPNISNDEFPATKTAEDLWLEKVLNQTTPTPYRAGELKADDFVLDTKSPEESWVEQQTYTQSPEDIWLENRSTLEEESLPEEKDVVETEHVNHVERIIKYRDRNEESVMMDYFLTRWFQKLRNIL